MTHHIFTKSGELFLIMEQVPERNKYYDFNKDNGNYHLLLEQHNAAISRLKDSAIRIPDYYNTLGMLFRQQVKEEYKDHPYAFKEWKEKYVKEGELMSIECEAEIKISATGAPYEAIIKPVAKREPQKEDDQNFVWGEFWNVFHHAENRSGRQVAYEAVKRQFNITRKSS